MSSRQAATARHAGPLILFAALTITWTWPLIQHLSDAIPGDGGDNYSFVWNLWWMRHVLATPGLAYFKTTFLFYPFGTTIADHPHTALPALVAATLMRNASVVTAQNILLLAYVFLNQACAYALAWDITGHRRAAVMAGIVFGLSPYIAVHLLGHFDLVAAWVLPLFALALRRAVGGRSPAAALAAGLILAATSYIAYYYVVYSGFFVVVYLVAWIDWFTLAPAATPRSRNVRRLQLLCVVGASIAAAAALAIAVTGGTTLPVSDSTVSIRTPRNVLTVMWLFVIGWFACSLRLVRDRPGGPASASNALEPEDRLRHAVAVCWRVALGFLAGAAPLLWQAAGLVRRGEYVTQAYGWRSIPQGVDLLAPLLGHPLNPFTGWIGTRAYAALHQDFVETIGWVGVVPAVLLIAVGLHKSSSRADDDARVWRAVGIAFAIFALGPFLRIGGVDSGLKLPEILLRFVPFAANARMPGRAMVGVFMALSVLLGLRLKEASGWLRSPRLQWLLIVAVVLDYWVAPIRLTLLDQPAVYRVLKDAAPGAVCEVPFGIGDGLSAGLGSQNRRVLFYATQHEHPLVGGYIGRMPITAAEWYRGNPFTSSLLALSGDKSASLSKDTGAAPPCRYLVVDRTTSSPDLIDFVSRLPVETLARDERRVLYRLR